MQKEGHPLLQNLFLFAAAALLCFFTLELLSRLYLNFFANDKNYFLYASLRQLEARARKEGVHTFKKSYHRYLGYYLTPNYRNGQNRHNSLGYRGEDFLAKKAQGEYRIVCLGGSTTYSSGVEDYRNAYPALLEQELTRRSFGQVKVINAGVPGWSSWESLVNFEFRVLDLQPDMIVVYHGINDVHPRFVWPPDVYRGDNSGRSLPAASSVLMPSILEYSTLIRIFLVRAGKSRPHIDVNKSIDRRAGTFYADDFQYQKVRQKYPRGIFKKTSAAEMLKTNPPVYFQRNIENIVYIAQSRGIKVILATFAVSSNFAGEPRSTSSEYLGAYDEHNKILQEISLAAGAYLFDFAAKFPDDKKYTHDGRHVNEDGAKLKATMFADFIVQNKLISK